MKREVRQRCGFGCVACGLPLYTYEHLLGWANVHRHVADELTLLCDRHQRERTNGLFPLAKLQDADRNPRNKQTGASHPYDLHFSGSSCELAVGGNEFNRQGLTEGMVLTAIAIDRVPMLAFTFEQGHLFLTLRVFDDRGARVVWIERNELMYAVSPWDIRLEGCTLTVREGQGQFLMEIVFTPPSRVDVRRGCFSFNGLEVLVYPDLLCYVNLCQIFSRIETRGFDVAIMIGEQIENGTKALNLPAANRGNPDREAAEQQIKKLARMDKQ